jgi:outer membrane immunogenic protein
MKKLLFATATVLALGLVAPASAADLAARPYTKAPPPMAVAYYDWSGFYIGANGGWGSSRKCWDLVSPAGTFLLAEGCHDATGGFAGGQIGYRWQAGGWVFGLEAQGDWADLTGSQVSAMILPPPFGAGRVTDRSKIDSFGLFTGQIGYAWNNTLFYFKGGAAETHDRYEKLGTLSGIVGAAATETRWGGSAGVGLEWGFAPGWSVGVEYDHLFMGTRNIGLTSTGIVPGVPLIVTDRIRQDVDLISARLNYHFSYGKGPVVARY